MLRNGAGRGWWVLRRGDAGRLPFVPRRVGSHWGGKGPQVDVVAINEDAHGNILGECKWQDAPIGRGAAKAHVESVSKVVPGSLDRWTVYHAFFSKSGFTEEARREMSAKKTFWIDLDDLAGGVKNLDTGHNGTFSGKSERQGKGLGYARFVVRYSRSIRGDLLFFAPIRYHVSISPLPLTTIFPRGSQMNSSLIT